MIPAAKEPVPVPEFEKPHAPPNQKAMKFVADLLAGGVAGGISKTIVAPIERVKLLLQTQDSNPRIKSGQQADHDCWHKASWPGKLRVHTMVPAQS